MAGRGSSFFRSAAAAAATRVAESPPIYSRERAERETQSAFQVVTHQLRSAKERMRAGRNV